MCQQAMQCSTAPLCLASEVAARCGPCLAPAACSVAMQVAALSRRRCVPYLQTPGRRMCCRLTCCASHGGCCLRLLLPATCWVVLLLWPLLRPAECARSSYMRCWTYASGQPEPKEPVGDVACSLLHAASLHAPEPYLSKPADAACFIFPPQTNIQTFMSSVLAIPCTGVVIC